MSATTAISLMCCVLLVACSSGRGATSLAPSTPSAPAKAAGALAKITVQAKLSTGLARITKTARRQAARAYRTTADGRRALNMSIQSIVATGTFYPGTVGSQPVVSSITENTTSIPASVTLPFSNVPEGNNQWVTVDIVGFDQANGTGSHVDLGQLGGLVNVAPSASTATIDAGSTARLQIAIAAMSYGILSTYDLQNESTLDTHMGTISAATPVSPSTGVYTASQIAPMMSGLYQAYNHTLAVSSSPLLSAVATVLYDYRDSAEKFFAYNVTQTNTANVAFAETGSSQAADGAVTYSVLGNPFVGVVQDNMHLPSASPGPAAVVIRAQGLDAASGTVTVQHIYGGKVIVGMKALPNANATPPPFLGGIVGVNQRAPGDTSSVNVPVQTSQLSMIMHDPQAAAMGIAPYYTEETADGQTSADLSCQFAGAAQCGLSDNVVTSLGSDAVNVAFSTFNPFFFLPSQLKVCTGLDCFPLVDGATNNVRAPFYDAGTNVGYYGWAGAAAGAVTNVSQVNGGYAVSYSGGTSGGMTTATPAYYFPQQDVAIFSNAPPGTIWTLGLSCSGNVVTSTGIQQAGYADVYVHNIVGASQCEGTTIGFQLPSGSPSAGSFTIGTMGTHITQTF